LKVTAKCIIANFFKQLGWVEELGSGVRRMYRYCPIYVDGAMPIIEDGDVFKLTIRHEAEAVGANVGANVGVNQILNIISEYEGINGAAISEKLPDVTKRTVERYLQKLRESGVIEFRGASKTGGYYILKTRKLE
jgi:ATP-dependent DNA helicase RecG